MGGAGPHSQKRKKRKMRELEPQAPCSLSSLRGGAPTARQVLRQGADFHAAPKRTPAKQDKLGCQQVFNRRLSLDASEGWRTVGNVGQGSGDKGRSK